MRCSSYCTAESYDNDSFVRFLHEQGLNPGLYDNIIHVQTFSKDGEMQDAFYFTYGCVVLWNFNKEEENRILLALKPFEQSPVPVIDNDFCTFFYSKENKTVIQEEEDTIILESNNALIKLSMSHALSQSVKLSVLEASVEATIKSAQHLPEELSTNGKISLSRRKLAQKIGVLFSERYSVNLNCDVLDTPEFFWRRPKYETYYNMAADYMDISLRMDILNRRLSIIHELYEILSNELNHLHTSNLEMIIIILILFEVVAIVLRDFFHII